MVSRDLIDQAGQLLAEAAGANSRVILFGSHARGEAGPDSDVDFLIIEPVVEIASESGNVCDALSETSRHR